MRFASITRPGHATVVAYLALFVALGGGAYAAGGSTSQSSTQTLKACVAKKGGAMRWVASNRRCKARTERTVTWNQAGRAGTTGAQGATGLQGPAGSAGTAGAPGAPGAPGANGADAATTLVVRETSGGATGTATASCLAGEKAVGGGASVTGVGDLKSILPNATGTTPTGSWTGTSSVGADTVTVRVVCASP